MAVAAQAVVWVDLGAEVAVPEVARAAGLGARAQAAEVGRVAV